MKRTKFYLFIGITAFVFVACQKEVGFDTPLDTSGAVDSTGNAGGSNTEVGTWKFLFLHVTSTSIVEQSDGVDVIKTIGNSDYTTTQNDGTWKFDGSNLTITGITYAFSCIEDGSEYVNGDLLDTFELPVSASFPPANATTTYKKIGADSLYMQSGVMTDLSSGISTQSDPAGYKLAFRGDTMTLAMTIDRVLTKQIPGATQTQTDHAVTLTTLKRM